MSTATDGANEDGADENAAGRSAARGSVRVTPGWLEADRAARGAHRLAVTRQAASVLLGCPGRAFFERLPLVARAVAELPWGAVRTALREFCEHAATTPEAELREHHADVFGHRSPNLASHGDASWRDHVLAEITRTYAEAGWPAPVDVPPDHLAVVLEFTARADAREGEALLSRLRPGLDLLGEALHDYGTPYARVVDAVRMSMPGHPDGGRPVYQIALPHPSVQDTAAHGSRTTAPNPFTGGGGPPVPLPRTSGDTGTSTGAGDGTDASDRLGGQP